MRFMARAAEHGLAVSKPWGEMRSYDFVIGKTGRFVSVQVKSTISRLETGYVCTVRGGHKAYPAGSFDFVAVYLVVEDAWYIIPAEVIRGKESLTLYPNSKTAQYEKYREAWPLLREASESAENIKGCEEEPAAAEPVTVRPTGVLGRMEAVANYVIHHFEDSNVRPQKPSDEI